MKKQVDSYLNNIKNSDMNSFGLCYTYFRNKEKSEDALSEGYLKNVKEIQKFDGKKGC